MDEYTYSGSVNTADELPESAPFAGAVLRIVQEHRTVVWDGQAWVDAPAGIDPYAVTQFGTPYVVGSDVVGQYPEVSHSLADTIDNKLATKFDKSGGVVSGDVLISNGSGYSLVKVYGGGAGWWMGNDAGAGNAYTIARIDNNGNYVWQALSINPSSKRTTFQGVIHANNQIEMHGVLESVTVGNPLARRSSDGAIGLDLLAASSRRYKTNIVPAGEDAGAGLLDVEVSRFQYREDISPDDRTHFLGFIAEDMAEHFPDGVAPDGDGQPNGVRQVQVLAGLVALVQKQQKQIDALTARVEALP